MKNILITGGLGFIGFNAVRRWTEQGLGNICVVDSKTYAAHFLLKEKLDYLKQNGINCLEIDISADGSYGKILSFAAFHDVDTIVNFAAESHVDNSITGPTAFFRSNVVGTANMLEVAMNIGARFHQVSTDEVYGVTTPMDKTQDFLLCPTSPYAASKAGADEAVMSFVRTYGLFATISRCSNNFGPWQHPEKLIPKAISTLLSGGKVPVYGDGSNIRQWIPVDDHVDAIKDILLDGTNGGIYNVSSNCAGYISNNEMVNILADLCGRGNDPKDFIEYVEDRKAHDQSYYIEDFRNRQVSSDDIDDCLKKTVEWYKENLP